MEAAGQALGIQIQSVLAVPPYEHESAFSAISRESPDGLIVGSSGLTLRPRHRARVIEFTAKRRLPTIYNGSRFVKEGGLMSYSADLQHLYRRVASGELREDLFWENAVPDYVIVGGRSPDQMSRLLTELYRRSTYELEAAIPVFWAYVTRPEIPWKSFTPFPIKDPLVHGVLIFQRTSEPAHPPKIGALEIEKYIHF